MARKAFTLTEILVVLLIITILISILLPAMTRARDKAKDVVCMSNMHQIYLAMKLYQGDYDGYPPNSVAWPSFRSYYRTFLRCPKSKQANPEFDYVIAGSVPYGISQAAQDALRACIEMRGPEYPLVRDYNHLVPSNADLPQSVLFFVREDGSFNIVPFSRRRTVHGPCNTDLVAEESNL